MPQHGSSQGLVLNISSASLTVVQVNVLNKGLSFILVVPSNLTNVLIDLRLFDSNVTLSTMFPNQFNVIISENLDLFFQPIVL